MGCGDGVGVGFGLLCADSDAALKIKKLKTSVVFILPSPAHTQDGSKPRQTSKVPDYNGCVGSPGFSPAFLGSSVNMERGHSGPQVFLRTRMSAFPNKPSLLSLSRSPDSHPAALARCKLHSDFPRSKPRPASRMQKLPRSEAALHDRQILLQDSSHG